jgi:outer membrane lipoprotein LolB
LALALAAALTGCASLPTVPPAERVHTGRFALTASRGEQSDNLSGRFTLAVRADGLTLDLSSPFGNTLARFETRATHARAWVPDGNGRLREARGIDAESLAVELLGWPLPVDGIGDWILGRPVPARAARITAQDGKVVAFEQDGWAIRVVERFAGAAPRRLNFERAAFGDAPAIALRVVLDENVS